MHPESMRICQSMRMKSCTVKLCSSYSGCQLGKFSLVLHFAQNMQANLLSFMSSQAMHVLRQVTHVLTNWQVCHCYGIQRQPEGHLHISAQGGARFNVLQCTSERALPPSYKLGTPVLGLSVSLTDRL